MTIDIINYKHILGKENELFAIYYPNGRNVANLPIEAEVNDIVNDLIAKVALEIKYTY